jgi:hypothetical protein
MTYDVRNSCPELGQTQNVAVLNLVNGIPTTPLLIIGSAMVIQI